MLIQQGDHRGLYKIGSRRKGESPNSWVHDRLHRTELWIGFLRIFITFILLVKKKAFSCRTLDGFRKNPKIPSLPSPRHPQNRSHKSNKVTMSVIQQKVFASKATFILRISLNGRPGLVNRTSFRQNSGFCNFFRNEKAWYRPFNNSNTRVEWAYLKKSI